MTGLDISRAKQALAWRLREWETPDPDARAASFIDDLVSQGWQMSPDRESRPRPPKPGEQCRCCGRRIHTPDAICDTPTLRPVPRASDADALARLRVIHDETAAELCSHHVSRANCLECRRPTDPTPEESA